MNGMISVGLQEASTLMDVSISFLRKEIRGGRLRAKKVGAKVLILRDDLEDYVKTAPDWNDYRLQDK